MRVCLKSERESKPAPALAKTGRVGAFYLQALISRPQPYKRGNVLMALDIG